MPISLNIRHIENKDVHLEGELPVAELELENIDPLIRVTLPMEYELVAQKMSQDILVQGRLQLTLDCECVRCLKSFQYKIDLEGWAADLPLEGEEKISLKNDCVDLTP